MTTSELKKLNRAELLTMLMSLTQRCDDLEEELEEAKKKLEDRSIEVSEAGTLAEAVLKINGVMEAVDRAGMQYLENLKRLSEEGKITVSPSSLATKAISDQELNRAKEQANTILEEAKAKAKTVEEETKRRCIKMVEDARREALQETENSAKTLTIEEAEEKAKAIENATKLRCVKMVEEAKKESQAYWDEVYSRIEQYNKAAESLRTIVQGMDIK